MKRNRKAKIVATIGPASCSNENIEKLLLIGVDVFRLNFSHGSHDGHAAVYKAIREAGKKHGHHTTILADLQGPKLRVGVFENDKIVLNAGDIFRFDLDKTPGNNTRVNLPHPEILEALKPGATLLLDDGKLRFEVVSCANDYAEVKVIVGGPLSNRKGVNVPDVKLPIPALTEKDRKDLDFALELGVDWVALSFVQSVEDVQSTKKIINGRAGVVSKLEKPLAILALEPIIEVSDAVMIARGDLAVEMSHEEVPAVQRRIIDVCHRLGRPVIVATQMLESMISCPSPTRAEVSDIATAVYSGTDATMLSAESASGQYPFEAVAMMSSVIEKTEADPSCVRDSKVDSQKPICSVIDGICTAARDAVASANAKVIVLFTESFDYVARCSRLRPSAHIIVATSSHELAQKVGLFNGVKALIVKKEHTLDNMVKTSIDLVKNNKYASSGDNIVVIDDIINTTLSIVEI